MSRKDEIIAVLKKHEVPVDDHCKVIVSPYGSLATEIEKLFEVEGKVEYDMQCYGDGKWFSNVSPSKNLGVNQALKRRLIKKFPDAVYRIIKRTTTDELVE